VTLRGILDFFHYHRNKTSTPLSVLRIALTFLFVGVDSIALIIAVVPLAPNWAGGPGRTIHFGCRGKKGIGK
jgi:hypothetical protein